MPKVKQISNFRKISEFPTLGGATASPAPPATTLLTLCTVCLKRVHKNQKDLCCTHCNHQTHIKCNDISPQQYESLKDETYTVKWTCLFCKIKDHTKIFPYTLVPDEVLLGTSVTDLPSIVDSLPKLEILSKIQNLPNLSDYDIDENFEPDIDSSYHNLDKLKALDVSSKDLSLFHMNIRSLSLHFDELHTLLGNIGIDFQLIGLSEIKMSTDSPLLSNLDISGYKFHHTPHTSAGGVGIYVKSTLQQISGLTFLIALKILRQFGLKLRVLNQRTSYNAVHTVIQVPTLLFLMTTFKKLC